MQEVQESWPQDAWELRDYLMARSPYLSTEVLKEMIIRNSLPQGMVLEICLANPEATKKEGFIRWAEYESPHPLPGYMIDLIAGSWEERTFRMELEAQMGQQHSEMSNAATLLQAHYRVDTAGIALDSMLTQWQLLPNYGARYSEAQLYIRMGEYGAARAVLASLDASYPMERGRAEERDRTIWFMDRLEAIAVTGRTIMQLDSADVAEFLAFATDKYDQPAVWVQNILCFGYEICLPKPGGSGGGNKSLNPVKTEIAASTVALLRIQPNPANVLITLAHEVNEPLHNLHARILDTHGRQVANIPIQTSPGQNIWDTRNVPAGVYSVEIITTLSASQ